MSQLGFDNLNPIIWHKIANANFEVEGGGSFLGKPYEPNAVIKNDIEFILMQRKPGGYRKPTGEQRALSMISKTTSISGSSNRGRSAGSQHGTTLLRTQKSSSEDSSQCFPS